MWLAGCTEGTNAHIKLAAFEKREGLQSVQRLQRSAGKIFFPTVEIYVHPVSRRQKFAWRQNILH